MNQSGKPASPPFPAKHLTVVGGAEGMMIFAVVIRYMMNAPPQGQSPDVKVMLLMGAAIASGFAGVMFFVLRSVMLSRKAQAGEDVEEARRMTLFTALAIIAFGACVGLIGPTAL